MVRAKFAQPSISAIPEMKLHAPLSLVSSVTVVVYD